MILLSWNPRGLGNPRGFKTLQNLLAREDPDIVFLQETKVRTPFFDSNKFKLGFSNVFVVDCDGKSRGLVLLGKDDIFLEVLNFSVNYIHGLVTIGSNDMNREEKCFPIGIYGHPEPI